MSQCIIHLTNTKDKLVQFHDNKKKSLAYSITSFTYVEIYTRSWIPNLEGLHWEIWPVFSLYLGLFAVQVSFWGKWIRLPPDMLNAEHLIGKQCVMLNRLPLFSSMVKVALVYNSSSGFVVTCMAHRFEPAW